ncbi:MAG: phosphoglycerate kinase [Chlamydiia bacterium]|nr:phosphoglycerate kinase [Chlamydiia bacterium]
MKPMTLKELDVAGKRVLMRVDFNVPFDGEGKISDDTRIRAALPSIQNVLERGGKVILMSHLGRPKGEVKPEWTLKPCAERLEKLLGEKVNFPEPGGGRLTLLENVRFHTGEEKPESDPGFVEGLAKLGDCYVNDAFGTAHRAHGSTTQLATFFPGKAAMGLLLEKEVTFLGERLKEPKRPFYAIIGGAKISTKIGVIAALLKKVDKLFIGGGMAYTFFKAQGIPIGESIHEDAFLDEARQLMEDDKIVLPLDCVTTKGVVTFPEGISEGAEGMDIGPKTVEMLKRELPKAETLLWNGPLGVFEMPAYAKGTQAVAQLLAGLESCRIIGGGDSVAAIQQAGLQERFTHLSTGGGASLEFIEKGTLPGLDALVLAKNSAPVL